MTSDGKPITVEPWSKPALLSSRLARSTGQRRRSELLAVCAAALLATATGVWVLQLWRARLQVPITFGPGDLLFNLLAIKDVLTHGWDLTNPSLGAPFGQEMYDFPALASDSFLLLMIKLIGVFTDSPGAVLNIFYLLGFPLIALTAFAMLRRLGISLGAAVVCAVLYAVLPFHFDSNEIHVFQSTYFSVPICCYMIVLALSGADLFSRDAKRSGWRSYLTGRSAITVATCLMLGSVDNYSALFTAAMIAMAAVLAFVATRRLRSLACSLVASCIIIGAVALNGLPTIVYDLEHGANTVPSHREAFETETLGLTLTNLVMPIEGNRLSPLAEVAHKYNSRTVVPTSTPESEPAWVNLGLIGTLGLLWITAMLGAHCVRASRAGAVDLRAVHAAIGAGMAFLIGTIGGLATLFAFVVSPQLHAPDRIALFVAFYALFGAALALDWIRERLGARRAARWGFAAILTAVLAIGVLEQTSPEMTPAYSQTFALYKLKRDFMHAIEAQLPPGSSVFQIPYVPFPQGIDPGHILEYEDLYGYLVSNEDLRWSGGAMEGRPTNWVPAFLQKPLGQVVEGISAVGFSGIYLDTAGVNNGPALIYTLTRELGVGPLMSADGRLAFFNMAVYNRRFRERHSASEITQIAQAALHLGS